MVYRAINIVVDGNATQEVEHCRGVGWETLNVYNNEYQKMQLSMVSIESERFQVKFC